MDTKDKLITEVGPWVENERFWNREAEIESLIQRLNEGANILITAPRRIGKTSLIRETENRIKEVKDWWRARFSFQHIPAAERE
ncbi:MAG: ATP-binding protein [bacterium]|nr:ATP-binding protein [bacterium]